MTYLKYDGSLAAVTAEAASHRGEANLVEVFAGTAANEAFWLSAGDKAAGGAGDDIYFITGANLEIVEAAAGGVDKVAGWQSLELSKFSHIENVAVFQGGAYAAGNALDNVVEGGGGAQQLYGGLGQDVLVGGADGDIFIVYKGEGNDAIADFNAAEDVVRLKAGLTSFEQVKARFVQVGADLKIDLGGGDGLMLRGVQASQLSAKNFQLELDLSRFGTPTFAEEFSGPLSLWDVQSNPTGIWRPDYGYSGPQGVGSYTLYNNGETEIYVSPFFREANGDFPINPFVQNADGTLTIQARYTDHPQVTEWGYKVTSGLLHTRGGAFWYNEEKHLPPTFAQQYGYFEMRADLSEVPGTWGAFWLLPADWSWPPELDILENPIGDPNLAWTTAHTKESGSHTNTGQANYIPGHQVGFHTYGALWSPETITWYVDGVEVFKTATPGDMHKPMSLLVNLATGGWAGAHGDLSGANMTVDYVRAYALPAGGYTPAAANTPQPAPQPAPTAQTPAPAPAPAPSGGATGAPGAPVAAGTSGRDVVVLETTQRGYAAGDGDDEVTGSYMADQLFGESGNDTLLGSAGNDTLHGGEGRSYLRGGEGDDEMAGGSDFDDAHGNEGNDVVRGGGGGDWVVGGRDNDELYGDDGGDIVYGNMGADTLDAGSGDDIVRGGQGEDSVMGGAGNDWISGDRGQDTLIGGTGADTFHAFQESGADIVVDFNAGAGDRVQLLAGTSYTLRQVDADTLVDFGGGHSLRLLNVQLDSLPAGWIFGA